MAMEIIDRKETMSDRESFTRMVTYTVKNNGHTYVIPNVETYTFGVFTEEVEMDRIISELLDRSERLDKIKKLLA